MDSYSVLKTYMKHWLFLQVNKTDAKVIVEHEVSWIKANLNGNGYYRVHYPPEVCTYRHLQYALSENRKDYEIN